MTTRLIIIGGFLGAGKTTLLLQAARLLTERGLRVGLITNDQGQDLVDTHLATQQAIPTTAGATVTEVSGGCFCCRFPDLIKALRHLQKTVAPDVILAEPVGSCTDLVATILRPLNTYYPGQFILAPLTILLDGSRTLTGFDPAIRYLYERQLAEADLIGLNKIDLISKASQTDHATRLTNTYPQAQVMPFSAHDGAGLATWLEMVMSQQSQAAHPLTLDYDQYAQAEALLGWLNARGTLQAATPFDLTTWLTTLFDQLQTSFSQQQAPIAHLKIMVTANGTTLKASLTQRDQPISWDVREGDSLADYAQFTLNARINMGPQRLAQLTRQAFIAAKPQVDFDYYFTHFESFSPAAPQPTHRLSRDEYA